MRALTRAAVLCSVVAAAVAQRTITDCPSNDSDGCIRRALQLDGAVSLAVEGIAPARRAALLAVAACTEGAPVDGVQEVRLPDGTSRRSLGTRTLKGLAEPLKGCNGIGAATAAARALVDGAAQRLLQALQPLQRGSTALLCAGGASYPTLADVARAGEQLEHFHAYRASPSNGEGGAAAESIESAVAGEEAAVPLHTDAGLFIAILPALYAATPAAPSTTTAVAPSPIASPADGGFYVQTWDGERAAVSAMAEAGSVVFVVGDGWASWLNPQMHTPLRAAPHGMHMPKTRAAAGAAALVRAWYGRMYLPPADAVQHPNGLPFGAWQQYHAAHPADLADGSAARSRDRRDGTAADGRKGAAEPSEGPTPPTEASLLPAGCATGRRFLSTASASSCLADQIFCWHQCISVAALPCTAAEASCRRPDGTLWTPADS